MRIVLTGLKNVSFYFDNVFIYLANWEEHIQALTAVLDRLKAFSLTAKHSKCRFEFPSIQYLGYIVDGRHIQPQMD